MTMIVAMTPPLRTSRLLLIADRRVAGEAPAPVVPLLRRYRIARLRVSARPTEPKGPFGYLKRIHD
jgi:hypothetical protein